MLQFVSRFGLALALLAMLVGLTTNIPVHAAPGLRVQVDQRGDFVLIGNTFGHECATNTPAPVVGAVGNCGFNAADSAPDIFWRSDSPADGQAEANANVRVAQARSTAVLTLPAGAQVTHAYLYWSAALNVPGSDDTATLDRPGAGGFTASITALAVLEGSNNSYRSVADVTALVQTNGPGAYRLSDVTMPNWVNLNNANVFGAWWMVVLYQLDTDPLRNLAIYDGLDFVASGVPQNITMSGFTVPAGPVGAKLGIVALDGDNPTSGDALTFNGSTLSDAQNPADNFFNGTRSYLGAAVSVSGDLPQLAGTPQSMSGIDLDVVDISPYLTAGQTSASIGASTTSDIFALATTVTSIETFQPEIAILGNNQVIAAGDASPSPADQTDFGSIVLGQAITRTFTISNSGDVDLLLTGSPVVSFTGPAAGDFSLVNPQPASPVISHTAVTFQVGFNPSLAGTRVATVTIANNDSNENPYDFAIQGAQALCFTEYTGDNSADFASADAQAVRDAIAAAPSGGAVKIAGYCAGVVNEGSTTQVALITKNLTVAGGYTITN
ncbi:MAG: choice-of-anchor D domain-containing protein [Anaerolineae bacterium]